VSPQDMEESLITTYVDMMQDTTTWDITQSKQEQATLQIEVDTTFKQETLPDFEISKIMTEETQDINNIPNIHAIINTEAPHNTTAQAIPEQLNYVALEALFIDIKEHVQRRRLNIKTAFSTG
jgi:hypothetical protein